MPDLFPDVLNTKVIDEIVQVKNEGCHRNHQEAGQNGRALGGDFLRSRSLCCNPDSKETKNTGARK